MNTQREETTYTVTIAPGEKTLSTLGKENLLALLTRNSILLRSDCGGKGTCQKCLVQLSGKDGKSRSTTACTCTIEENLTVTIPTVSLLSPHIIQKAEIRFPDSFSQYPHTAIDPAPDTGIAVDLGTTTIAIYIIDRNKRTILSSIAIKNPQSLYGDDVISRIGYIGHSEGRLKRLQQMITGTIQWAVHSLLEQQSDTRLGTLRECVVVGNPAMLHILLGVSPASIGVSPYKPQITSSVNGRTGLLEIADHPCQLHTLPNISGFLGGDILAAAIATELAEQPEGTLLVDLGTNGELLLKGNGRYFATSCATGPAFEGATLACGIQAIPGAIDKVVIGPDLHPTVSTVTNGKANEIDPIGVCGSGVISCIAECLRRNIVRRDGSYANSLPEGVVVEDQNGRRYPLFTSSEHEVFVSQKDIRNVQLGKAALISGTEFLLKAAGYTKPHKIIVAGAFGSHLEKEDLLTLGMLPQINPGNIILAGNAAGAGAIMSLCDKHNLEQAVRIGEQTSVINLADDPKFQSHFIERLSF